MAELEPVPEDWTRGLAVVAHPDDLEYGAASAIARWTGQGKEIAYCLVTAGEAGIDAMAPDEAARVRRAEEEARGQAAWTPHSPRPRAVSTALRAYGMLASSADRGGVRDLSLVRPAQATQPQERS